MDITEDYIKMCFCKEVQGVWKPDPGDWVALYSTPVELHLIGIFPLGKNIYNNKPVLYVDYDYDGYDECEYIDFKSDIKLHVWLPRQDQIQKLLGIESFKEFCATPSSSYYMEFDSWEKNIGLLFTWIKNTKRFGTEKHG